MSDNNSPLPEMSLEELFASARTAGASGTVALTLHFQLSDCACDYGTLTISRNPTATRWLTTLGLALGTRYYARIAQGKTPDEALDKIERYCHWWLRT